MKQGRLWRSIALASMLVVALACGTRRAPEPRDALEVLDALAAHVPALQSLAGGGSSAADAVSARLPERADGPMEFGAAQRPEAHLRLVLVGAAGASGSRTRAGRVVYDRALPSTDRVVIRDGTSLEELLVLHDAAAPRQFTWNIHRASGIARVVEHDGGLRFEDANGNARLAMRAPLAWDAKGSPVPLSVAWHESESGGALTLALGATVGALTYPLVVDPRYDVSVWIDVGTRTPTPRNGHALVFDSARNEVVLFGGYNGPGSGFSSDTWVWTGSGRWSQRLPPTVPPPRANHAMAYDAARGEIVLFSGSTAPADTWVWNGATWTQRMPAMAPTQRFNSAMTYDATRREVVLFGGFSMSLTRVADTWAWDGATWTQRMPATSPPVRENHALTYDVARAELVLYGGTAGGTRFGDTWVWADGAAGWVQRTPATSPGMRFSAALTYDSTRAEVMLFGGQGSSARFNDTWVWNGTASTWTQRAATTPPPARSLLGMAHDSARNEVVMFGGLPPSVNRLADTWAWSGATSTWTLRTPATSPPGRYTHALAYDSGRGEVVLFGGTGGGGGPVFYGDTWVWDGTTWTQRTPPVSPLPRSGHAMAYDAARSEVVLFSGSTSGVNVPDTWVWNGTAQTWTQRTTSTAPSVRTGHAMTYDAIRREVLLFGGLTGSSGRLGDTWTWDGTTWTQRVVTTSPPARNTHTLVFDSVRNESLLFAGGNSTGFLGDEWAWHGDTATWTQRFPAASPAARISHGAAFDASRGELVLFGGVSNVLGRNNETWVHGTLGGSCATSADCIDTAFCTDGVCCNAPACAACETCAGTSPGRCAPVLNTEDADTCAARDGKSCSNLGECKLALGTPATSGAPCASGFAVDGVCCTTAQCGACQACSAALKGSDEAPGICLATKAGLDPHDDCEASSPTTCGNTGACDGNRRCQLFPTGTACGSGGETCSGTGECLALRTATCDGDHNVIAPDGRASDCAPYKCEGAACKTSCASKNDCAAGADCTPDHVCTAYSSNAGVTTGNDGGCMMHTDCVQDARNAFLGAWAVAIAAWARRARGAKKKGLRRRTAGPKSTLRNSLKS